MNSVEPSISSLGGAPGRAFLKFKAWILFSEPGKYRNTFCEAPHCAAEELETHRAQAEEGERVSRAGSLGESPRPCSLAQLSLNSTVICSSISLFSSLENPLTSLCADYRVCGPARVVGAGSRSPPRCGGNRGELIVGWVSLCHAPVGEG